MVEQLAALQRIGKEQGVDATAVAIAWLLRHPSKIVPVLGTNNIERIKTAADALRVTIDRQTWFELYTLAIGNEVPWMTVAMAEAIKMPNEHVFVPRRRKQPQFSQRAWRLHDGGYGGDGHNPGRPDRHDGQQLCRPCRSIRRWCCGRLPKIRRVIRPSAAPPISPFMC